MKINNLQQIADALIEINNRARTLADSCPVIREESYRIAHKALDCFRFLTAEIKDRQSDHIITVDELANHPLLGGNGHAH